MSQSVVLGYLTEYFSIQDPSPQETRDAYLFATGESHDYHVAYCLTCMLSIEISSLAHTC